MKFRNSETKSLLSEESDEVKEEVRVKRDAMDFGPGLDGEGEEEDASISLEEREREKKTAELQRYAHLLP